MIRPNRSFIRYTRAVLFPFLFAPIAEIRTGHAAPTPIPSTIGKALANVKIPVTERACSTPTVADALWKTAVNSDTYENTCHRVGKHSQHLDEHRIFTQRRYRSTHHLHTCHQNGKTKHDISNILMYGTLTEHTENNTNYSYNSRNRRSRKDTWRFRHCFLQYKKDTGSSQ